MKNHQLYSGIERGGVFLLVFTFFALSSLVDLSAQGKNRHTTWELLTPTLKGKPGQTLYAKVRVSLVPNAHLYTTMTYEGEGPSPTEVTVGDTELMSLDGQITSDVKAIRKYDPAFSYGDERVFTEFWKDTITLTIPIKIAESANSGESKGWINIYFMTCDHQVCLPPTDQRFDFELIVKNK